MISIVLPLEVPPRVRVEFFTSEECTKLVALALTPTSRCVSDIKSTTERFPILVRCTAEQVWVRWTSLDKAADAGTVHVARCPEAPDMADDEG